MRKLVWSVTASLALAACNAHAETTPEQPRTCSCDDLDACTAVKGVPILFARRDMVHEMLTKQGAKRVVEGRSPHFMDEYNAPESGSYTKVVAFYDSEQQLAQVRFELPSNKLDVFFKDPTFPHPDVVYTSKNGRLIKTGYSDYTSNGGTVIVLSREKGKDRTSVQFIAPEADARLDAELHKDDRNAETANAADHAPAQAEPAAPTLPFSISTLQGTLEFRAEEPLLAGKRVIKTPFCGRWIDPATGFGISSEEVEEHLPDVEPHDRVDVERDKAGRLRVMLSVRDDGGNRYRFEDVREGATTHASAHGDCRRRKVTMVYRHIDSPLCVTANFAKQSWRTVLDELVQTTGITVDGTELISQKSTLTMKDYTGRVRVFMGLLADLSGLELIVKDEIHFAFRKPEPKIPKVPANTDSKPHTQP